MSNVIVLGKVIHCMVTGVRKYIQTDGGDIQQLCNFNFTFNNRSQYVQKYVLLLCSFQLAVNTCRFVTVASWAHMYLTFLTYYNHALLNDGDTF
jgi:hypothetical protein